MKTISLPVLAAGVGLAFAGLSLPTAAMAAVTIDGYSLDEGNFGAQHGVHADEGQTDSTVTAYVNQDDSWVTFTTTSGDITINGSGEAVIDGNDSYTDLHVVFEHGWDKITFNLEGADCDSAFTLLVNGSTLFSATPDLGDPACTICVAGENGSNKFIISGSNITDLYFTFDPGIPSSRQFRVMDASIVNSVPEPASWALMIAGIGFAGFAMRRRPVTHKVSFS